MPERGKGKRQWRGYRSSLRTARLMRRGRSLYRLFLFCSAIALFASGGVFLVFVLRVLTLGELKAGQIFFYLLCSPFLIVWGKLTFKVFAESQAQDHLIVEERKKELRLSLMEDLVELDHDIQMFEVRSDMDRTSAQHERLLSRLGLSPEKELQQTSEETEEAKEAKEAKEESPQLFLFKAG